MRICLVGATHPCHNPRLLREADSLVEGGHDVRVVAPAIMPELREKDARLLRSRQWRLQVADYCPTGLSGLYRAFTVRGRRRLSSELFKLTNSKVFAEGAYIPALTKMTTLAASEPADWFIAHAHGALPIAATVADRLGSKLAFDCEDLLSETEDGSQGIVRLIESRYLSKCNYISVPSECIGNELRKSYGIRNPVVLYNVFPLTLMHDAIPPQSRGKTPRVRVHWFGQTIGAGRGLEEAIEALALLPDLAELHLRGRWAPGYEEELTALANRKEVRLIAYPPLDHDQLLNSMTQFDIGLALELPRDGAYSHTVTNKIGSYLLAGLAIAATETPGQREVLGQEPRAGFLYPPGRPDLLAAGLKRWIDDHDALREAQQAAWDIARERFCWDIEQDKFFSALGIPDGRAAASKQST